MIVPERIEEMKVEIITDEIMTRYMDFLTNSEIFGIESGRYTCFGAYEETETGKECTGILSAEILPSYIHIERICVHPNYKWEDAVSTLMSVVSDLPDELKLPIITYGTAEELDADLLHAVGFRENQSVYSYLEGTLNDYQELPSPPKKGEYQVYPMDQISINRLSNIALQMRKDDYLQMPESNIDTNRFSAGSPVCMRDDVIEAAVLYEEKDQIITVPFIFGKNPKATLYCFSVFRNILMEEYAPGARIRFLIIEGAGKEAIMKIIQHTVEKQIHIYEYTG